MNNPEENIKTESEENKWAGYMQTMGEYVDNNDPNQLEDLLREPHPLLPGEKEAFDWLVENLDRDLRVKPDKSGYHIIPIEQEEEEK